MPAKWTTLQQLKHLLLRVRIFMDTKCIVYVDEIYCNFYINARLNSKSGVEHHQLYLVGHAQSFIRFRTPCVACVPFHSRWYDVMLRYRHKFTLKFCSPAKASCRQDQFPPVVIPYCPTTHSLCNNVTHILQVSPLPSATQSGPSAYQTVSWEHDSEHWIYVSADFFFLSECGGRICWSAVFM